MRSRTQAILEQLRQFESRNITFVDPDGSWPIVWQRAKGSFVWDVDGKRYLDLTAAFGVAVTGHANPRVVQAGQRQMAVLLHAMGDVHPHPLKSQLAAELSRITFGRWHAPGSKPGGEATEPAPSWHSEHGKVIFCNSGFEAVEAALKTALLATRKSGVLAFRGAYHGLGYGALNATHREHFRGPFRPQLANFAEFLEFPTPNQSLDTLAETIDRKLRRRPAGAVLVEPIQARGGIRVPPPGFLPLLRQLCDQHEVLLILDEIYTGFGRTGQWFACEHSQVKPDLICLGKALTGGFPLSACVGRAGIMDAAWPPSTGEAIHTSTFLGHPVGCAMALAQIQEIRHQHLPQRAAAMGKWLRSRLIQIRAPPGSKIEPRGLGLLAGLEIRQANGTPATGKVLDVLKHMLREGFILLPEGEQAEVIALTPPLTISKAQLDRAIEVLERLLALS